MDRNRKQMHPDRHAEIVHQSFHEFSIVCVSIEAVFRSTSINQMHATRKRYKRIASGGISDSSSLREVLFSLDKPREQKE
jgi:hypothetical protein